ncbi:MAG: dihydroorotate dehydrogenase [Planctomycetes bacterium]|nr:dihydroorotate dehydrogenase [Planctomycetota bacterium]
MNTTLSTNLAGLNLSNPVMLAAGTAGYLDEMGDVLDVKKIGAVVTKSITAKPRDGNATWRIIESRGAMMNAVGLANMGVDAFMRDLAPRVAAVPTKVVGSISGFSVEDFVTVAAAMDSVEAIGAVELNVSCPNVHLGVEFGSEPKLLAELISAVRPVLTKTRLFVKLSPIAAGRPGIVPIARAAVEPDSAGVNSQPAGPNQRPGADAVCLANTMPAMAIDVHTRKPRLSNITGGLSGPAIHPIAVKLVHDVYRGFAKDTHTPLIGIGGVLHWEDAAEFILAGATAVEMGTALFVDPRSPLAVVKGLQKWVHAQGATSISELIGAVKLA